MEKVDEKALGLERILESLIDCRNHSEKRGLTEEAEAESRVIDVLKQHPYFKAQTAAALTELALLGQKFENDV